jgi:hypothetical protein
LKEPPKRWPEEEISAVEVVEQVPLVEFSLFVPLRD